MAGDLVRNVAERERLALARSYGRSPSVFLGRVPAERHEHYDPDDNLTGYTIVIREPEWTDDDRARARNLAQYEAGVCACGFHTSLTTDKDNHFTFDDQVCPVCAGGARYARVQKELDDGVRALAGKKPSPKTPDPADGRRTFTRLMSPTEVAEIRAKRSSD